jgi:RNA polymerase sigma-70 factor, ECF subfamily
MHNDKELINKFIRGDKETFNFIVDKHKNKVFNIALGILSNKFDADDVSQEVFLKFFLNPKSYKGKSNFSTWLYRVTVNLCFDFLRKNKNKKQGSLNELDIEQNILESNSDILEDISKDETSKKVKKILSSMDEKYRTVLILTGMDNMSYKETAEILNVSVNNVKILVFRAKEQFRILAGRMKSV